MLREWSIRAGDVSKTQLHDIIDCGHDLIGNTRRGWDTAIVINKKLTTHDWE